MIRRMFVGSAVLTAILCAVTLTAAARELIPGGCAVGLQLDTRGVIVAAKNPDCQAPLCDGDRIVAVDRTPVSSAEQVRRQVSGAREHVALQVERDGRAMELLAPLTREGKLGVLVRDQLAGIGTVTYVDPATGAFGCLGHGVTDPQTGQLLEVSGGQVLSARIVTVEPGKPGQPGKLEGAATSPEPIGTVEKNTGHGVFGTLCSHETDTMPVAEQAQIKAGPAVIRSNVSGQQVQEYDVEILQLYPLETESGRNLLLRVTDTDLLTATGGIVQGMSGSPIIQDGKLVGAVTHVLVNDPTRGYGIFIENMLEAAG